MTTRLLVIFFLIQSTWLCGQSNSCANSKRHVPLRGGGGVTDPANSRSDTLDVLHYDIAIDMRGMSSAQIAATCRIDLVSRMDDISSVHLDLLALQVDSVYNSLGSLSFTQGDESV
ncbi:MAG: hypothetical protein ACKOSR_02545, partial [Flavobacteriales bacterium]